MADPWGGAYLTERDTGGTQYRNAERKIGKYRNTVSKSTKYRHRMYDRLRLLKVASIKRNDPAYVLGNLSHCEKT